MAWLSGYTYRMDLPVAKPTSGTEDRAIDKVEFPGWFLKDQGKITKSDYSDIRVTKSDGTTILRHTLSSNRKYLYIDYPSMPAGREILKVYYGNSSATAPDPIQFYTSLRDSEGII